MQLNIELKTAQKIYPESSEWFKAVLTETFGEKAFKPKDYTDIKTFDDACQACGLSEKEFNDRFNSLGLDNDTVNYEKSKIIVKAINQGWTPDWNDSDQRKWYPWFEVVSSGFGFSFTTYYCTLTITTVGSRLCFETSDKCKYAATQFIEIYKQFLL